MMTDAVPEDVWDAADRLSSYLSVLLAIEYDIDTVDRIAKARKLDDFMEGVYNALRRRSNLEDELEAELKKLKNELEKATKEENKKELTEKIETLNKALEIIRGFNPSHIEKLRNLSRDVLKLVASYIGSRALAYTRTVGILTEIFQTG